MLAVWWLPNWDWACASSHHWSRELQALGHTVRLMPPTYVKPYVNRQKTTPRARKPSARRSRDRTCGLCQPRRQRQSCLMLHRARHLFIRQQTAIINRAYLPADMMGDRADVIFPAPEGIGRTIEGRCRGLSLSIADSYLRKSNASTRTSAHVELRTRSSARRLRSLSCPSSNSALIATMIVLADISAAPSAGVRRMPHR
jgi:hypothetical protein